MTKRKDLMVKKNLGSSLSKIFDFGRFHGIIDDWERDFFSGVSPYGWWTVDTFKEIQPHSQSSFPKVNVVDKETSYKVEIAVAGFTKDDLSLELKDNCLFITAKKEETTENGNTDGEGGSYIMKEIATRSFKRVVRFPSEINPEGVKCSYKDGVVECFIDKKEVEKKDGPVRIEIE